LCHAGKGLPACLSGVRFQHIGGEAVAQDVHGHAHVDPRQGGGGVDGVVQLPKTKA
jgi:hypothetical protein